MNANLEYQYSTFIDAWDERLKNSPESPALIYLEKVFSARELDRLASRLANGLEQLGIGNGDRIGLHLQNTPHFIAILLAAWKLNAVGLLLNPMYKGKELSHILRDSGASIIVTSDSSTEDVGSASLGTNLKYIVIVGESNSGEIGAISLPGKLTRVKFEDLIQSEQINETSASRISALDLALLTYTSGTTGPSKGAMNSHGNVLSVVRSLAAFIKLDQTDVTFGLAPLFHITGAVAMALTALYSGGALVLAGRFDAEVAIDQIRRWKVTYMVGAITAYIAMMHAKGVDPGSFDSIRILYSGGAPIAPMVVQEFRDRFGHYIHNAYGMTETASGVIAVPPGSTAPIHEIGGLSIGIPLPGLEVKIIDQEGKTVPPNTVGELAMKGPQVMRGYWRNQIETTNVFIDGWLRSGDAALIDEAGWIYLVDRIKDQINVSGYKVWPKEVEDAIYENSSVREASVVGVKDEYQGESVVAYVTLKIPDSLTEGELRDFVRTRLAAYKVPRHIYFIKNLPKTLTGKVTKNKLRTF